MNGGAAQSRSAQRRWSLAAVACCLVGSWALPVPGSAQDVAVRAYVDRAQVGVNQSFTLTVEISGPGAQTAEQPEIPDLSGFAAYLGSGSSQQIQIVNGRTSITRGLQYRYQATAAGSYRIDAITVRAQGETYRTDPLQIEVVASSAAPSAPPRAGGTPTPAPGRQGETTGIDPEDLFLRATVSKRRAYQNEPIVVEYKIYTRVRVTSYSVTRPPTAAGFWAEEYPLPPSPEVGQEILNGREYAVATLKKTALYATGAGPRTIDPMTVEATVRVRGSFDPFDDIFASSSLFGRSVPVVIASQPVTIDIEPLPEEGKPSDFGGLVGELDVVATVDKTEGETNEPITVRIEITGRGNLRTLPEPSVEFPADFEVYPPDVTESLDHAADGVRGRKTYEYVTIPRAPGTKRIAPVRMSYFDPRRGDYVSVASSPMTIEVTGDPVLAPVAAARGRSGIRPLREDIRFIQTEVPRFTPVGRSLFNQALFWIVLVVPLLSVGGAWGVRRHRDRLEGDVAYARTRRASRVARKRLAAARSLARQDGHAEFYAEAGKALLGFLADKLNIAEAGFVRDEALEHLRARGVTDETAAEYLSCLDVCDLKRFSPAAADHTEMQNILSRAETVMSNLDRELAS